MLASVYFVEKAYSREYTLSVFCKHVEMFENYPHQKRRNKVVGVLDELTELFASKDYCEVEMWINGEKYNCPLRHAKAVVLLALDM